MKKLIIFAVLLMPMAAIAQTNTQEEVKTIQLNLVRSHERHKMGTAFYIGAAITGLTSYAMYRNGGNDASLTMGIISGAMFTAGFVIHIDAHKFIGRAGRGKR